MICKYCNTKIDADSIFCENCGERVQEIRKNDETQLIPAAEPAKPVVPSRSAAYAAKAAAASELSPESAAKQPQKDIRVKDISKLLAEIYDAEEEEQKTKEKQPAQSAEPVKETVTEPAPEKEAGASPEDGGEPAPVFCMACGKMLPAGAAFCDTCGTATGTVTPVEIRRRRSKESAAVPILKEYFKKPAEAIDKAASQDALSLGIGIFAAKDVLFAILAAVLMPQLTAGMEESWLLSGDAFGLAAKVLIVMVLADLIMVGLVFSADLTFKGAGGIKEIIAACGTANILPAITGLLALVLYAFAPMAGECAALVTLACGVLFSGKAISAVYRLKENKTMYAVLAVLAIYTIIIYGGLTWIIA